MKKCPYCAILPIVTMLIIVSCQATPTPIDPVTIQNTAVAQAWTSVAQTQTTVDIVSTVNAQGTQIAILSQPTIAITPTRVPILLKDKDIIPAIMSVLGGNENEIVYNETYYDGQISIGSYFRTGANATGNDNGFWFVVRDSNNQWVAKYVSQGLPLCEKIQDFKVQYASICLDINGNQVMIK